MDTADETVVAISSVVIVLTEEPNEDTLDLASRIACLQSEIVEGPSGKCQYEATDDWQEFESALRHSGAQEPEIDRMRDQWLSHVGPAPAYRVGVIHWWIPPGATMPPPATLHAMIADGRARRASSHEAHEPKRPH